MSALPSQTASFFSLSQHVEDQQRFSRPALNRGLKIVYPEDPLTISIKTSWIRSKTIDECCVMEIKLADLAGILGGCKEKFFLGIVGVYLHTESCSVDSQGEK